MLVLQFNMFGSLDVLTTIVDDNIAHSDRMSATKPVDCMEGETGIHRIRTKGPSELYHTDTIQLTRMLRIEGASKCLQNKSLQLKEGYNH